MEKLSGMQGKGSRRPWSVPDLAGPDAPGREATPRRILPDFVIASPRRGNPVPPPENARLNFGKARPAIQIGGGVGLARHHGFAPQVPFRFDNPQFPDTGDNGPRGGIHGGIRTP